MVADKVMPALPLSVMNVMDGMRGTQEMVVLGESSVTEVATPPLDFAVGGAQLLPLRLSKYWSRASSAGPVSSFDPVQGTVFTLNFSAPHNRFEGEQCEPGTGEPRTESHRDRRLAAWDKVPRFRSGDGSISLSPKIRVKADRARSE